MEGRIENRTIQNIGEILILSAVIIPLTSPIWISVGALVASIGDAAGFWDLPDFD